MRRLAGLPAVTALVFTLSAGTAGAAGPLVLPDAPDVGPLVALVERPDGDCNAAEFFESAEKELRRRSNDWSRPVPMLAADDFVLALVLRGLGCRASEFSYSRRMAIPPTEQPIPAQKLYRAAAARFVEDGRRALRDGDTTGARAEFGKAVVLGLLLYQDPGITVIQDWISFSVLARGAEGLGDVALVRGDSATADVCARFLAAEQAYVEGVSRFLRSLPLAAVAGLSPNGSGATAAGQEAIPKSARAAAGGNPSSLGEQVRAVAALYDPSLRTSLRGEILLFACVAGPLVPPSDRSPLAAVLESATRDTDARLRAIAAWGARLTAAKARTFAAQLSGWPAGDLAP